MTDFDFLGLFPGAMSENSAVVRRLVDLVLDDNAHWRRNYFPSDQLTTLPSQRAKFDQTNDELEAAVLKLVAELRRSFPFHSPRYLAHQQSETSIASLVGLLAGVLYNANNVTSESGNATLELELEAASRLLTMIGYRPPPPIPEQLSPETIEEYTASLAEPFGWAHLCSGGTTANMEALWVARNVMSGALAIRTAAKELGIDVDVVTPGGEERKLADLTEDEACSLNPQVAVGLMNQYLQAGPVGGTAQEMAQHKAGLAPYLEAPHTPPKPRVVFSPGSAHYSIEKAANMLGVEEVVQVRTDAQHRMDVKHLYRKIRECIKDDKIPMAVVCVLGTTEEGAFDPLDEVIRLRETIEAATGHSFWIHADGAWGGYSSTMLRLGPQERFEARCIQLANSHGLVMPDVLNSDTVKGIVFEADAQHAVADKSQVPNLLRRLTAAVEQARWRDADSTLASLVGQPLEWEPDFDTRRAQIERATSFSAELRVTHPKGEYTVSTGRISIDTSVLAALEGLELADSVTVDPHKMGYLHYACGAIAFKSDAVRSFVKQEAPYITQLGGAVVANQPLMRLDVKEGAEPRKVVDAPAPYTLEGSRPSSAATALWLSTEVLPLTQGAHGAVVSAAWRSSRRFYEWLTHWDEFERSIFEPKPSFQFVPLSADRNGNFSPPDSNLVLFAVKPSWSNRLADMNALTEAVYQEFSIKAESGEHRYSYSQPFFASNTIFSHDGHYPIDCVFGLGEAIGLEDFEEAYKASGITALRSTIMNPYLEARTDWGRGDEVRDFVVALRDVAHRESAAMRKRNDAGEQGGAA